MSIGWFYHSAHSMITGEQCNSAVVFVSETARSGDLRTEKSIWVGFYTVELVPYRAG